LGVIILEEGVIMKKALKVLSVLLAVMLLCVGVVGCEQNDNTNETKIYHYSLPEVTVGQSFKIVVEEKGACIWDKKIICNLEGLDLIDIENVRRDTNPNAIGGGIYKIYTFRILNSGDYVITLNLRDVGVNATLRQKNVYKIKVLE
jgi:hypothetical protein